MRRLYGDWRDIFKGFRIALDPRKITLAIGGILLSATLIVLIPFLSLLIIDLARTLLAENPQTVIWDTVMGGDIAGLVDAVRTMGVFALADPAIAALMLGIAGLASWYTWAYFAGGICRLAAVEIARDERIGLNEALGFAREKFRSIYWSPVAVVLAIAFFGVCNLLLGVIGRVLPWGLGSLAVGVLLVAALFAGFLMALLAVGLVCAWPLMITTICAEGTDGFDAISRSMSYLYARPWRYLWCRLITIAYGIPCVAFIALFASLIALFGIGAVWLGMDAETFDSLNGFWMLSGSLPDTVFGVVAAIAYTTWIYLLIISVAGYAVSYALTSSTIVYMILRKAEDGTEMTEVFEEEDGWDDEQPAEEKATTSPSEATA